jgi:hypothetical protein
VEDGGAIERRAFEFASRGTDLTNLGRRRQSARSDLGRRRRAGADPQQWDLCLPLGDEPAAGLESHEPHHASRGDGAVEARESGIREFD